MFGNVETVLCISLFGLFLLCWKEKLRNNIVIIYSSDPRGVSKFLVSASFFFVYISFCLVQLRFSSCDWERKFPDSIPEGCLLIKASALGKFGKISKACQPCC